MTSEQREQAIDALMGAIGGALFNGEPLFDADIQRMQVGKFVDLLAQSIRSNPACAECGEPHPFYGTCRACEREHCDCHSDSDT